MTAWAPPLLYQAQSGTGNAGGHLAAVLKETCKTTSTSVPAISLGSFTLNTQIPQTLIYVQPQFTRGQNAEELFLQECLLRGLLIYC